MIKTVPEFDDGPVQVSNAIHVVGKSNAQSYIILFGSYKNKTEPPVIKALNIAIIESGCIKIFLEENTLILLFSQLIVSIRVI